MNLDQKKFNSTSMINPTARYKDHTPKSSEIYPWDTRMVTTSLLITPVSNLTLQEI